MSTPIDYFCSETIRQDLKGKTVRGGMYTAVAQAVQIGTYLAAIPILGRLLTPEDFGLVAMVVALSRFANMFVDVGLGMATVQQAKITHAEVSNLFWVCAALGCVVAAIFSALAPAIALFYDEPRLIAITLALCTSFVFAGLTMQHQALLRRVMHFRAVANIQVLSVICGNLGAIVWAWSYRNSPYAYWAMVILPVVMALVRMVGMWWTCRWRPSLPLRGTSVNDMLKFGGFLTGVRMTNYFSRNLDKILIGWYSGAAILGLYERAYRLLLFPITQINGPVMGVTVPALSRTIDEPVRYCKAFRRAVETLLLVSIPFMACVLATRDLCIEVLLGPQWTAAIPIFGWLGIAALFEPFMATLGWLLISQGRTREMFAWSAFALVVSLLSYVVGLLSGGKEEAGLYVAACYVIASGCIRLPTYVLLATRTGPVRPPDLVPCVILPGSLSIAVLVGVSLLRPVVHTGNNFVDLGVCFTVGGAIWLVGMLATAPGQRRIVYYRNSLLGKQAGQ